MDSPSRKKAQKTQYEYDIVRFISQGSFNCAVIIKRSNGDEQVLRIALLPKHESRTFNNMMVKRGIQIVHVFQPFKSMLGPSLLLEISEFEFRSVKMSELRLDTKKLCPRILAYAEECDKLNIPYEFAIQIIELLQGEAFDYDSYVYMTDEERAFACFSLFWFMHHAQSKFDFGHHDLKPDNVIFRHNGTPLTYAFRIGDRQFVFTSRYAPVVIDYDFATVFSSNDPKNRNAAGTPTSVSPDAMVRNFLTRSQAKTAADVDAEVPLVMGAHDWWSLGVLLLQYFLPHEEGSFYKLYKDTNPLFNAQCIVYGKHVGAKIDKLPNVYLVDLNNTKNFADLIKYIPIACTLACLAADGDTLVPPLDCSAYVHRSMFFEAEVLDPILATPEYQKLRAAYMNLPRTLRDILRMLLSWYPERRIYMGRPYMYLFESYFRPFEKPEISKAHNHYTGDAVGWLENAAKYVKVLDTTKYPLLASCVTCGIKSNISLCVCCDQVFCSQACQDKH